MSIELDKESKQDEESEINSSTIPTEDIDIYFVLTSYRINYVN